MIHEATPHVHALISPIDRESGEPRFNAKKWLGGKELMKKMQDSYAKAMEPLGLQRGEENSRATHQDLQTFYRALNNVVRQKLPKKEQFQDDLAYQQAIDQIYYPPVSELNVVE